MSESLARAVDRFSSMAPSRRVSSDDWSIIMPGAGLIVVTHVQQARANWCWAACCEMLVRRCGENVTQDVFASLHNARWHHGMDHQANANEVSWLLDHHGGIGRSTEYLIHVPLATGVPRPTWDEICADLDRAQMYIVSSAKHAWLVVGYGTTLGGQKFLWAHDPASPAGPVKVSWDALQPTWTTTVRMTRRDVDVLD